MYELLTGTTPFDKERLGKAAYDEIRRIIREEEPPKPSTRISTLGESGTAVSEHRKTEPKKLSALLRGDLDWIVMKALEKDRTRRYETANDFAADVQHYLSDQPVEARPPSTIYRFQKLVRRYRIAAATIALVAVTLVAATGFSTWMAVSENRARQEVQAQKELAEESSQVAVAEKQKALKAVADLETSLEIFATALGTGESTRLTSPDQAVSEMLDALAKRLEKNPIRNSYVEANVRYVIGVAFWNIRKAEAANTQFRLSLKCAEKGRRRNRCQNCRDIELARVDRRRHRTSRGSREAPPRMPAVWVTVGGGEA